MSKLKIVEEVFEGRHFDREVIILWVRWYLRFKVSLRDLVEMMAERGLSMAHTTIMRWVQRYAPEFEKRWRRFARAVGRIGSGFFTPMRYRSLPGRHITDCQTRLYMSFRQAESPTVAAAKAGFRAATDYRIDDQRYGEPDRDDPRQSRSEPI
jgi:hypothetical protein